MQGSAEHWTADARFWMLMIAGIEHFAFGEEFLDDFVEVSWETLRWLENNLFPASAVGFLSHVIRRRGFSERKTVKVFSVAV